VRSLRGSRVTRRVISPRSSVGSARSGRARRRTGHPWDPPDTRARECARHGVGARQEHLGASPRSRRFAWTPASAPCPAALVPTRLTCAAPPPSLRLPGEPHTFSSSLRRTSEGTEMWLGRRASLPDVPLQSSPRRRSSLKQCVVQPPSSCTGLGTCSQDTTLGADCASPRKAETKGRKSAPRGRLSLTTGDLIRVRPATETGSRLISPHPRWVETGREG